QNSRLEALVVGFLAITVAVVLLSPALLGLLARLARPAPIAIRLALRDLARYRTRSGAALAAISLSLLIAVIVCVVAAARFGDVLDYVGPNLSSNQLIVNTPSPPGTGGPGGGPGGVIKNGVPPRPTAAQMAAATAAVHSIAAVLGTREVITLEDTSAGL